MVGVLVGWYRRLVVVPDIPSKRQNPILPQALFGRLPRHCGMGLAPWKRCSLANSVVKSI